MDILVDDNVLFRRGLTLHRHLMQGTTFSSYLDALWNVVFQCAPAAYLLIGLSPVAALSSRFFLHVVPFILPLELAMMVGTRGIAGQAATARDLASFPVGLRALWTVLRGQRLVFRVTPKDRQSGRFLHVVRCHIAVVAAAAVVWGALALCAFDTGHMVIGVMTNAPLGPNNGIAMSGIIRAAL